MKHFLVLICFLSTVAFSQKIEGVWHGALTIQGLKLRLDFNISNIDGCIITHEHGDHCGKVMEYLKAGIKCYSSQGTIDATKITNHNFLPLSEKIRYQIGEFNVLPFPVKHDCKQPFGYLVHHAECGLICFVTDTCSVPFKFQGLNQIMIEVNFSQDIIDERAMTETIHISQRNRIIESHLSLESCKKMLLDNDLKQVNNIVLLHLSDRNSNAKQFVEEIENLIGKKVFIADSNLEINFNKQGF
jgi:phosphoribosyl 1,2-cyclic phosphodiesterase